MTMLTPHTSASFCAAGKVCEGQGAGHYSFLPKCTPYIAENFGYLCRDFGQDRDTIHRTVEQVIHRFLDKVKTGEIQGR